jgi:hypothetical protein
MAANPHVSLKKSSLSILSFRCIDFYLNEIFLRRQSSIIIIAALKPGIPVTPPIINRNENIADLNRIIFYLLDDLNYHIDKDHE